MEIIMLTNFSSDQYLFQAICGGASGYLPKSTAFKEIREYINIMLQGGAAITPILAKRLIQHFHPNTVAAKTKKKSRGLSDVDLQILKFLAAGYSYNEIATITNISVNGVRYHIKKIYKILHVNNKVDAIRQYQLSELSGR